MLLRNWIELIVTIVFYAAAIPVYLVTRRKVRDLDGFEIAEECDSEGTLIKG